MVVTGYTDATKTKANATAPAKTFLTTSKKEYWAFSIVNHQDEAIIVTGGQIENSCTNMVLRLELFTLKLTQLPRMNEARCDHGSAIAGDTLAVFLGWDGSN